jgi:hypothetical protein
MKNLSLLFVSFVLIVSTPVFGAFGDHQWSAGWGAGGGADPDGSGRIAVAGTFFSPIDLGGDTLTPGNVFGGDLFVTRFDADGTHLWSQQYTPGGFGAIFDGIAAGPDGSIVIVVTLQSGGNVDFGGGVLSGDGEMVVACLGPDGSHRWSFTAGSGFVRDVDFAAASIVISGYTYDTVDFGGGALASAGDADVFVASLRPDGSHRFSAVYGDAAGQGGMAVAAGPSDGVILASTSESPIDFGGGPLAVTGTDLCVAAFDSTGAHRWSRVSNGDFSPGAGILATVDLDVAADGDVALGGQFSGAVDFGDGARTAVGGHDGFLAIYDANGDHVASRGVGGTLTDGVEGIAFDAHGNVAIAGTFLSPTADFGGTPLTHSGGFGADWFASVFDETGSDLFSRAWTGSGQYAMRADFTSADDLFLTGSGLGGTDFGGGALSTTELFVVVLEGAETATTAPAARGGAAHLSPNVPNPFNPATTIRFRLDEDTPRCSVQIHDVAGRLVRVLHRGPLSAGNHSQRWNGRDDAGRPVASGVYVARLEVGGQVLARGMALVR